MKQRSWMSGAVGFGVGFVLGGISLGLVAGDMIRRTMGQSAAALAGSAPGEASDGSGSRTMQLKAMKSFGSANAYDDEGGGGRAEAPPVAAAAPVMEMAAPPEPEMEEEASVGKDKGGGAGAPTRAWFPETFLFEPLVVTDANGSATVPVRVPDRLTQWRVLALAHSRSGAQAGAVTSFAGTLPTYVDPVLPPFLRAGDTVRLPVQVVNTTDKAVEAALKVDVKGAQVDAGARTVRVPARGSVVELVTVKAGGAGPVTLRASLGDTDAVVRDFDVWATGQPVVQTHGGSLAAPRTLSLTGPQDAQAGSERVRLQVYPGALGVVRAELATVERRPVDVAGDAYALLLAGQAPELLRALGETADPAALKALSLVATQRVLRAARAPPVDVATRLAEGALAHPDNPVLARLGERLVAQVAQAQRPDGTCQGGDGWTLQRLLVATADCARVVRAAQGTPEGKQRAAAFTVRASGVVERYLPQVKDGYTAAVLLAEGTAEGSVADALRTRVREALKSHPDGTAWLPVEPDTVRADGQVPSEAEATAMAVLALRGDAKAPLPDLGAWLLAHYTPGLGWGDGQANRVGLRAALALFKDPLPARVRVTVARDGQVVTEGTYDTKALREVLALEAAAPGSAGTHAWTVRAEPAVPGLGFSLALSAAVPWKAETKGGLQLAVTGPKEARVGQLTNVRVQVGAPASLPLRFQQDLPAGVQVDPASLAALVASGQVTSWDVQDGALSLDLAPREQGAPVQVEFRVLPTLGGTLQAGAARLGVPGRPDITASLPPSTWAVR
ncbi:alpha-2-macroglobulin family protein [Corallococcus interemptor]|uniref:alpha-2-macroglobulin family protein n=1 Tax=Corallococcus interemptor TaxID=2316720 RepID=UPI003CFD0713